jgi:hypothetical protein
MRTKHVHLKNAKSTVTVFNRELGLKVDEIKCTVSVRKKPSNYNFV